MSKKSPVYVTNRKGERVRLLRPDEKGAKFAKELKDNTRYTNVGRVKTFEDGSVQTLTNEQKAYRSGYLTARSDNARCWKSQQKKSREHRSYNASSAVKRESFKSNRSFGRRSTKTW